MNLAAPRMDIGAPARLLASRGRRPRRRSVQIFVVVVLVAGLLLPAVYLFVQVWISAGGAIGNAATQRATVAYARPLNKLLAALVDAQYAAVRGTAVDAPSVRAAVDEVTGVDRRLADPLRVRQRWTEVTYEIDGAIAQNPSGPEALRAYGAPIALTQALLDWIADVSAASGPPGSGSTHLIDVALHRLPDVVAAAGQVAAVAFASDNPRLSVALDRLARASDGVGTGLRAGTDPAVNVTVDLGLLVPLDEFAAATGELTQTAAELDGTGIAARDRVDAASTRVRAAALALETAVLNAFDAQLTANAGGYTVQRRILVAVGVVIALAAAALLWLQVWLQASGPAKRPAAAPDGSHETSEGRHAYPAEAEPAGPRGAARIPDLMDARELLVPEFDTRLPRRTNHEAAGSR
jgi:hypothetical protein